MNFVHRTDPSRSARVEGSATTLVLHYTDAKGKERKKSFKAKNSSTISLTGNWLKLLRQTTRTGFVAAAPQPDGPVRWLVFHDGPYYGEQPFVLDRSRQRIWLVSDERRLLRIQRDSCVEEELTLEKGVRVAELACTPDGRTWALLSVTRTRKTGVPDWRQPADGDYAFNLVRVGEDMGLELIRSEPFQTPDDRIVSLCVSDDGHILCPAEDGAALLDPQGNSIATFSAAPTEHTYAKGALSPSARWVALTAAQGQVRVIDRESGAETLTGGFAQVLRLQVDDEGLTTVFGLGPADWGIYRLESGGPTRISGDVHGQPGPDGGRVLEVSEGLVALREAGSEQTLARSKLPVLIGRHGRAAFWDEQHAVVRMKGHTPLLELDLSLL